MSATLPNIEKLTNSECDSEVFNKLIEIIASELYQGKLARSAVSFEQAAAYLQRVLKLRLSALGDAHADTGTSYNSLGYIYTCKGECDKAISIDIATRHLR